ncbi:MAG: redox-regulated ATPase YchF [Halobacteriales archaeon]|nr:redox-regulated ATPase YchF [Halobacteriales archaeon]
MLRLALAGKPNAGKSTFFKAATMADVDVANYPFTTIDPNRGVTHVRTDCPCLDLEERCGNERCHDGKRYVPVELLDVAGLVPGASEGRGLGNQFLDALMDADAVLNVIDAAGATDAEGEPVEVGTHDPVEEADFIETELVQWLAGVIGRNWETVQRRSRSPEFDLEATLTEVLSGLGASEPAVVACLRALDYPADPIQWTDEDRTALASELRERTKPLLLVANKADLAPAEHVERLRELDRPVQPATADGELALRKGAEAGVVEYDPGDPSFEIVGEASESQRAGLERIREVMDAYGGTGVQAALDTAVYELLDHIVVFPVENETRWTDGGGNVLPDAFLLPAGSTPRDLAYAVHSDIGDGYLHAVDARSDRRIGEDHELSGGDVIKIVSTAS